MTWTLAYNYNKSKVTSYKAGVISAAQIIDVAHLAPNHRATFSADWVSGPFTFNARENYYSWWGDAVDYPGQKFGSKFTTDVERELHFHSSLHADRRCEQPVQHKARQDHERRGKQLCLPAHRQHRRRTGLPAPRRPFRAQWRILVRAFGGEVCAVHAACPSAANASASAAAAADADLPRRIGGSGYGHLPGSASASASAAPAASARGKG